MRVDASSLSTFQLIGVPLPSYYSLEQTPNKTKRLSLVLFSNYYSSN